MPVGIRTLSRFFEYSLAISAWKQAGEVRWALRSNPSSGNLHPTEGYLLIAAVPGLSPFPALYHYAAKEHALELRAELPKEGFASLMQEFPRNAFLVGFSSVNWRETWKYGIFVPSFDVASRCTTVNPFASKNAGARLSFSGAPFPAVPSESVAGVR